MTIQMSDITGIVLAGGQGSRMGGVDKGLQPFRGMPLAQHALKRLAPQVGSVMLNANRNLSTYRAWGVPVWPDEVPDYPGPLAGMLAGLVHCSTPYLVTVACDTPDFPSDLVERLAGGLADSGRDMATAHTREDHRLFAQPVFCLMKTSLLASLSAFVERGERKTGLWARTQGSAEVVFDDSDAFVNLNTLAELEAQQNGVRGG